ncbi:MAG TPA: phage tail sheath subtilisin-like domain-containing protein [Pyrinomonadaceae bacterium]|jgi:phage tail sheath protein FI|nr:phage tail sheath subtilisin-like domain-containing protein [Pyrinomonadaceae bacterium]
MNFNYRVPGVYKEDLLVQAVPPLPTGVPGFVGFADARNAGKDYFNQVVELYRKDEFDAKFVARADSYLSEAVAGFFHNGGTHCYVVRAATVAVKDADAKAASLTRALQALESVLSLDLIAIPDAMTLYMSSDQLDTAAVVRMQQEMLRHCEAQGGRLAILDSLPAATTESVRQQRTNLALGVNEPLNGALYYPWIKVLPNTSTLTGMSSTETGANTDRFIPPSGHVAGIFSRSDNNRGVFKAPANEELNGVIDLETPVDNRIQDELNPEGINCLRAFPGRGIRVWGARTLSRDPNWRYINVRRLFLTLRRWIDANMTWANFESNTPLLWVRIARELGHYLEQLWVSGALVGRTPAEAFYVKCDAETNPPEVRELGQTITEVGLAPSKPAEFIVMRVIHHVGIEPR